MNPSDDDLPSGITSTDQLGGLPPDCLSSNPDRPLRHIDENGDEVLYSVQPMSAVWLILVVEAMERFSFYGVYFTQTLYLTGVYNEDWNAGLTAIEAASYVSSSTAVAYSMPFVGAWISDYVLGDYWTIVLGSITLYIPGLLLMAMTSIPNLLGETFNKTALACSLLVLWPAGSGFIKSVVNVFGAKQFHPLLQRDLIESYYVSFYTSINVGSLIGISLLPIVAQYNVSVAYILPVLMLSAATLIFLTGSNRFVVKKPWTKKSLTRKNLSPDDVPLSNILRISLLIVPFAMGYSQMPTTLIVQGTVMRKAFGFIDAATINFVDALSVLVFGSWTASVFYPALVKRGIQIPTTYKFALGSLFGMLAITWAFGVDCLIREHFKATGESVSILWQTPSYILIACGEIFAISAAYEVAFKASSPSTKGLASAINIFCVGGIPNVLCVGLYHLCRPWFRNSKGIASIVRLEDYTSASVHKYFGVLVVILLFGVVVNLLPDVRNFVESVENKASRLLLTPGPRRVKDRAAAETTPLLEKEFILGQMLHRAPSMRASSTSIGDNKPRRKPKASYISRLYNKSKDEKTPLPLVRRVSLPDK